MSGPSIDNGAKDAATKQRIIKHMNSQHTDSLSLYLRHYLQIHPLSARNPTLVDLNFNELIIQTSAGDIHRVTFPEPLTDFAETRVKVVEMDKSSRVALGEQRPLVTRWTPPTTTSHKVVGGLVLFYLLSYSQRDKVVPGTFFYNLHEKLPGGDAGYKNLQEKIFVPLIVTHLVETVVMAYRLNKANVKFGSGVWLKWIVSCLIEGVGSHQRLSTELKKNTAH
jgi:hypothetical protein